MARRYLPFSLFRHNRGNLIRYSAMRFLLISTLLLATTACTWVPIESSGKTVRVLAPGAVPAGCQAKGEVVVTVKSKVGFYNRNPLRVPEGRAGTPAPQRAAQRRRQRRAGRRAAGRWQPALCRLPVPAALKRTIRPRLNR